MNRNKHIFIQLLPAVMVIFFAISALYPAHWNWSIFRVYGKGISLTFFGIILLVIYVTPISRLFYQALQWVISTISGTLSRLPRLLKGMLWIIIPMALLSLLKTNSHILGDGDTMLRNIASRSQASPSIYGFGILLNKLADLFSVSDKGQAAVLLSSISIIAGVIFLFFVYKIINLISRTDKQGDLFFLLMSSSAIIVLFTGYTESYPILVAWLSVYIYYSLLYLKGEGKPGWLAIIYILGLFWNLWFIAFLPSLLYLINEKARIIPMKILIGLIALFLIGVYTGGQIIHRDGLYISVPIFGGHGTNYTLFSIAHLLDVINEMIILGPVLGFLAIILLFYLRDIKISTEIRFLLFAALPALVISIMIDPIIGGVRDWDLLSIYALPLMILGLAVFIPLIKRGQTLAFIIPAILCLNIFHTSAFIVTNKNPGKSVDRVVRILSRDPHYQAGFYGARKNSSMAVILANEYQRYDDAIGFLETKVKARTTDVNDVALLANYYYYTGRYKDAAIFFNHVMGKMRFLPKEIYKYGYSLYSIGEYPLAIEQFRSVLRDTCMSEAALYMASSFAYYHELDSCKKYCDLSVRCSQDSLKAMHDIVLNLPDHIFPALEAEYETQVLSAYPDSLEIRNSLIRLFQQAEMPDSAQFYMNYGPR